MDTIKFFHLPLLHLPPPLEDREDLAIDIATRNGNAPPAHEPIVLASSWTGSCLCCSLTLCSPHFHFRYNCDDKQPIISIPSTLLLATCPPNLTV